MRPAVFSPEEVTIAFLGSAIVRLGVDDRDLIRGFDRAIRKTQDFADVTERVGASMTLGVTTPLAVMGGAVLNAVGDLDALRQGLRSVVGPAEQTAIQLERLEQLAKLPGIGFEEAIRGSVNLQSVGFSAEGAERALREFSNAVAFRGGGPDELARVSVQLGQLAAKGKVLAQDLRPIIENAPAVGKALRDAFGTVDSEQIQALGLSTEEFLGTLLDHLEKLPRVNGGLKNSFDNLRDSSKRALDILSEDQTLSLTRGVNTLADKVERAGQVFAALDPTTKRMALALAGIAAAIGPATFAMSKFASAVALTRAGLTVMAGLPGRVAAGFAAFNKAVLFTTQGGVIFNTNAKRFQDASGLFVSRAAAMAAAANGTSRSMAVLRVAGGGLVRFLTGPTGIVLGLTAAAAAFVSFKLRAAEARVEAEGFRDALAGMSEMALRVEGADLDRKIWELERAMKSLPKNVTTTVFDPGLRGMRPVQSENPALTKAQEDLDELRSRSAAVENALESLGETAATTDLGDFGAGAAETAMERLEKRIKLLLGIYDGLNERQANTVGLLRTLTAEQERLDRAIKAAGDARTDEFATLLELSNSIREVWDQVWERVSGVAAVMVDERKPTPGSGGRGEFILARNAKAFLQGVQRVAVQMDAAAKLSLADRVRGLVDVFVGARKEAEKVTRLKGIDKLDLALGAFVDRLSRAIVGLERSLRDPVELLANSFSSLSGAVARGGSFLASLVNPVNLFRSTLDQVARNMAPDFQSALAPLEPVFRDLAEAITPIVSAIAQALGPVIEALVPVFEKLGPVVAAIAQVLAPVLAALVPLLDLFRIGLEIAFPVLKAVVIALTYLGQVVFTVAGGIAKAIGSLIEALGKALDKVPFLGDFGLIKLGKGIKEAGSKFLDTSRELGKARDEIKDVEIGDALDNVADSANRAAAALTNLPDIFDYALRRRMAAIAGLPEPPAGGGGVGNTPPSGGGGGGGGGGGSTSSGGSGGRPRRDPQYVVVVNNPGAGVNAQTLARDLAQVLNAPGTSPLKVAVQRVVAEVV